MRTAGDSLDEVGMLMALQQAVEKHPGQRPLLHRWIRERLSAPLDPGGTPLQNGEQPGVAWLRSLLQQLTPADVTALRRELEALAAVGSPVQHEARRLLSAPAK